MQHVCISQFIYMYTCIHTYMYSYTCTYIKTGMHAYMYVHMCMDSHTYLIHTYRQTLLCVYKYACIHTYITHTFQSRNIHNFRVDYFHYFQFAHFKYFQISGRSILLKIWKSDNYGSTEILQIWLLVNLSLMINFHCLLCN